MFPVFITLWRFDDLGDVNILWHSCTEPSCEDTFQLNSRCYKVYKNDSVSWYTAINRCHSNNGTLAIFADIFANDQHFPSAVLSDKVWIGLVKSWWMWSDLSKFQQNVKILTNIS